MPDWVYQATVKKVHDGDTLTVDLDMGMKQFRHDQVIRVAHIDAPELNTPAGKLAAAFAQGLLPPGTVVTIVSHKWDDFGRLLASVESGVLDFGKAMIEAGHAVPYEGGKKSVNEVTR